MLAQQADCALWIPPQDPQALAEAIKDLRKQPELLDRYGSNGRKYVTVYFISENYVLPRIAGSSMGVVRDDGSADHFSFFRPE